MFPGLPPPFGHSNQNQGMRNVLHGTNPQLGVQNLSNMGSSFFQPLPSYAFPVQNHPMIPLNVQSVAPQSQLSGNQLASPAMAFDGRNVNMLSLCGNPLGLQSATFPVNHQPQCLSQSPAMLPQMMQGHSCSSNQLAHPAGFRNPGLVATNSQLGSGIPVLSSNVAVASNNGQLHDSLVNQCNLIAQILSQNMTPFGPIAAQQVLTGALPQHNQVPSGMHQIPLSFGPTSIQQNLLPTMTQNGSQFQPATAAPSFNMSSQHNQAPHEMHQEQCRLGSQQIKTGGGESINSYSHVGHSNASNINLGSGHRRSWGKESKNFRFQKGSFDHLGTRKHRFMRDAGPVRKGPHDNITSNCKDRQSQNRKRSIQLTYTEEEIHQWREERRKSYPTNLNIERKAKMMSEMQKGGKLVDANAEKRRQQLKEILTRQAELGIEVAELPPGYLSDSKKTCGRRHNKFGRDSFKTKHDRNHKLHGDRRHAKMQKFRDETSSNSVLTNREPTLLQKLLSADLDKDKSRLLQVFRFMTINFFFEHWPGKPLQFPLLTVKDCMDSYQQLVEDKGLSKDIGVVDNNNDNAADEDGAGLGVGKEEQKFSEILDNPQQSESEEGEIIN